MVKSAYHYMKEAWRKPKLEELRKRLVEWRKSNAIVRVEKPTRLDRARELGYKAKRGFVIARVRLARGGRKRPRRKKGRKSRRQHIRKTLGMNYRWVAEQRAERRFKGLVVLNSYHLAKDGKYYWFEVILVDPTRPEIKADKSINWICSVKGRAFRGLTSAARKARGLR